MANPSISASGLSSQELANGVPGLFAKVAHLRPHILCLNGKGMWLHVERLLQQRLLLKEEPVETEVKIEVKEEEVEIEVKEEEVREEISSLVAVPTKQEAVSSSPPPLATPRPQARPTAFTYGLQPFKAVHSAVPNVSKFLF